jgi:hypothetical protein
MVMTRFVLFPATAMLLTLACNLPKSMSFGEDQATAESSGGRTGTGSGGAGGGGTSGRSDGAVGGGSTARGNAGSGGSEATGGSVSASGTVGIGGAAGTGAVLATGGIDGGGGAAGGTGSVPATGGASINGPSGGTSEGGSGDDAAGGRDAGVGGRSSDTGGAGVGAGAEGGVAEPDGVAGTAGTAGTQLTAKSIASGRYYTCALMNNGTVKCWGSPGFGLDAFRYGDSCPDNSHCILPVSIPNVTDAVDLVAADTYTCVLRRGGTVQCWGAPTEGESCDAIGMCSSSPMTISGLTDGVGISYSAVFHCWYEICAVQGGGTVKCVGDGCETLPFAPPTLVTLSGISTARSVGGNCAVLTDGTVQCWDFGSSEPVAIAGVDHAVSVSGRCWWKDVGISCSRCAVLADGSVTCWGGDPPVATAVEGVTDAVAVDVRGDQMCAVLSEGGVKCWASDATSAPYAISGIEDAIAITGGSEHTGVLLRGGAAVKCWGDNMFGQLGNGTTEDSGTPVTVQGL